MKKTAAFILSLAVLFIFPSLSCPALAPPDDFTPMTGPAEEIAPPPFTQPVYIAAQTDDNPASDEAPAHPSPGADGEDVLPEPGLADSVPFSAEGKYIAISFDDGPSKYTPKILDILAKYGAKATFFVVGNRVEDHSGKILRMVGDGHEVANHTYNHANLTKLTAEQMDDELRDAEDALSPYAPAPALMRPPAGAWNASVTEYCAENGLSVIYWSVDPQDYKYKDAAKVSEYVISKAKAGDIILMHDIFASTVDAAELIIKHFTEQGYVFVTVSQLITLGGDAPEAGTVYHRVSPEKLIRDDTDTATDK